MKTVTYLYWWTTTIIVMVVGTSPLYGQPDNESLNDNPFSSSETLLMLPQLDIADSDSFFIPLPTPVKDTPLPFTPIARKPVTPHAFKAIQGKKVIKVIDPVAPDLPQDSIPKYKDRDIKNNLAFLEPPIDFTYDESKNTVDLIRFYTENEPYRQQVSDMLGRGKVYFPVIDDILQQYDLPKELRYLPAALSALRPTYEAKKAKGVGLWQLPYRLSKAYGLHKDNIVDERKDIWLSTHIAAQILKDLYTQYEDWNIVIAAYTSGIGVMNKTITQAYPNTKTKESLSYKHVATFLPEEYQLNVPFFIAVTYAMVYHQKHNIKANMELAPISFSATDTVTVDVPLTLKKMLDWIRIDEATFYFLNPSIKRSCFQIPANDKKKYTLTVPKDRIADLVLFMKTKKGVQQLNNVLGNLNKKQKEARIKYFLEQQQPQTPDFTFKDTYDYVTINPRNSSVSSITHIVAAAEDIKNIASIYNCTIRQLVDWNNLSPENPIVTAKQKLKIYVPTQFKKMYNDISVQYKGLIEKMDGEPVVTTIKKTNASPPKTRLPKQAEKALTLSQYQPKDQVQLLDSLQQSTNVDKQKKKVKKKDRKSRRNKKNKTVAHEVDLELHEEHGEEVAEPSKEITVNKLKPNPDQLVKEAKVSADTIFYDGKPIDIDQKYVKIKEYIVKEGEDIEMLRDRYNTLIRSITYVNNLPSVVLFVGQALIIPTKNYPVPDDYPLLDK